ncbi:hypothetical protein KV697_17220 [Sphingomonas sanguinis]|uniref:hypothetical protein n=1 Tax=Sphingomonas sanguinis TaxID=33051 RepID=UPI001C5A20F3|nr:hypothetical protein [Sphingomonas sanguinis]QXT35450.1 hypothetical protein KV697_17220 [Sphingomonas sanguinis]
MALLLFLPAVLISMVAVTLIDLATKLPRIASLLIAVLLAPIGSLLYFYIGAGVLGLMAVLYVPLFLLFGLVGALVGLKSLDVLRDLRGHDQI